MKLAGVTFQALFPAINVQTTRLSACQVRPGGSAVGRLAAGGRVGWSPGRCPHVPCSGFPFHA